MSDIAIETGAQPGGAFGAKTLHGNFDICRNFQRIMMDLTF